MRFIIGIITFLNLTFSESLNMNLVGFFPFDIECSDITGFELHGRAIAVVGLYNGTSFVDISDPQNPFELQRISGDGSIWRDVKYWDGHVYIGTEADMGVQVVDVSDLDNIQLVYTISDFDNSHNIHVWEGYLFVIGADIHDLWIYDISNPALPNLVGTWSGEYFHDIDVHNNKVYGMGIYSSTAYILDISDITNPATLVSWTYQGMAHDAAVFTNEQYLVTADEMEGGHLKIWDISDYENISEISSFQVNNSHSLHNIYFKDDLIIGSWYADGTRVLDVSDPYNPVEVGFYDTTEIEGLYVGNWGTYVYLPSGLIISSDIESGLYILEMGVSVSHSGLSSFPLGQEIPLNVSVSSFLGDITLAKVYYKDYFGDWDVSELEPCTNVNSNFCASIPEFENDTILEYYFYVENSYNQTATLPLLGDENPFTLIIGELPIIVMDNVESTLGWTIGSELDDATAGIWEFGNPNPVYVQNAGAYSQPADDNSVDGENCFITGNGIGDGEGYDDIDGGRTTIISPFYDLIDADEVIFSFALWYSNNFGYNPGTDVFNVDYRQTENDNWTNLYSSNSSTNGWQTFNYYLSNYINEFTQIQFQFIASDYFYDGDEGTGGSLVEAAIDDLIIKALYENIIYGDANLDGNIDITDVITMVNFIVGNLIPDNEMQNNSDINEDGFINIVDIVLVVNIILY